MPYDEIILEGIVTTLNEDRSVNISPMGPWVDRQIANLRLRPFKTSRTYANLKRDGGGVFHVTDDVKMIARCAVGDLDPLPPLRDVDSVSGRIITSACRWYAFRVRHVDDLEERSTIECEVIESGHLREFLGFNRAKHAVVEAAILATRVHLIDPSTLFRQLDELAQWVRKTGGQQEREAFDFLRQYVQNRSSTTEAG